MADTPNRPLGHRVPEAVHEQIKRLAKARGSTAGQVITDALALLEVGKALTQAEVLRWIKANTSKPKGK